MVSFHAHPDDEALLTAGTLAKAVSEGHRVVLVVATAGGSGLAAQELLEGTPLKDRRLAELAQSANTLGCARVVVLGYGDSGDDGLSATAEPFAAVDPEDAAGRLASILREERADVLTIYDPAGGYGHPDHVQVHRVGIRAAELASTPLVLEATIDRSLLRAVVEALRKIRWLVPGLALPDFGAAYTARDRLTHRIDVTQQLPLKRAALAAHVSQSTSEAGMRTIAFCLRLPEPLFRRAFRHEWFVERGRAPARPLVTDLFDSLRA